MSKLIPLEIQWDIVRRILRDPMMEPGIDAAIAVELFDRWNDGTPRGSVEREEAA